MRGDVKVMWVQTTNPWVSIPNLNRYPAQVRETAASWWSREIYPTPTTEVADSDPARRRRGSSAKGVFGNTERRTQQWNKMVDPPGEAKEDAWQIVQVAKRMGMEPSLPVAGRRLARADVRGVPAASRSALGKDLAVVLSS